MSMQENLPAIRFKEFDGKWDKKLLGELVQLENGFAFQSRYFKKIPTGVIVLTPGSVYIGGGFQAGKGQYYDVKQEVSPRYIFKPDDMFITMTDLTPTAQALGFPAVIPRDNNTYLHNQRLGKLVGFKGNSGFLYNLLCTPKKQKEVVSTSSGTTVKHTSPDKFLNRFCFFPKNDEQIQIGNYFQRLDNLINQHQQKHDKLSSIKKAMLEKMFPKQGETIPEIRFKGFGGEWRKTDLASACSNFQSGKFIKAEDIKVNGAYPVYGGNGLRGFCSAYNHEGIYALIGRQGALCGNMNLSHGKAFFTEHAIAVQANKDCDTLFLFYKLGTMNLGQYSGQSAQPGLSVTNLIKLIIFVPEYREQNKIGNYFQKLDTLINQHQQQITKLNNIKQACLSKMFV